VKHLYITQNGMYITCIMYITPCLKLPKFNKAVWSYPKLNEDIPLGPNLNGAIAIWPELI